MDFGIRCVIAEGFADIFYNNCFQNGLLPIALPAEAVETLMEEARGGNHVFTVDLAAQTISAPSGRTIDFDIDPGRKAKLLQGLDAIGETLREHSSIEAFEARRSLQEPWMS
jgi:3-isopropylmalate dehydratase small subunit